MIYQGQSKPGWPARVAARQRPNEITEQWKGREEELLKDRAALDAYYQRMSNGDPAVANLFYGQGAGAISELKSAHDIVNDMVSGAVRRLRGIGA